MTSRQSKPRSQTNWALLYALGALLLFGAALAVWLQEGDRPWQDEVVAINQRRGQQAEKRLLAAGTPPLHAAEVRRQISAEPPRMVEIVPTLSGKPERCLTCHKGIEQISVSHPTEAFGCVVCHGGNGLGLTKAQAHKGLRGRNPSRFETVRDSCGSGPNGAKCHAGRDIAAANTISRAKRGVMSTMTGVLTSLRVSWDAQDGFKARYGTIDVNNPEAGQTLPPGAVMRIEKVPPGLPQGRDLPQLADEQWRKFCARCHLNAQRESGHSAHGEGCAACHGVRDTSGRYQGLDAAIDRNTTGHAKTHEFLPAPEVENCLRCHNRSGRIGLNFHGWMEDESGRVPWTGGDQRQDLNGRRSVRHLLPDAHAQKGMTCIDCHTPMEVMGDGNIYGRMRYQTEVRCTSCHGAPGKPIALGPPNRDTAYELRYGPLKGAPKSERGQMMALSAKNRPLANVRASGGKVLVYSRSTPGKVQESAQIDTDPAHNIPGHERLACQACHSRWTPQCYGCHDYRDDEGGQMWDFATQKPTPGVWRESRDLYRFNKTVLGLDFRGKIRPFAPGCQAMLTVNGQVKPQISRKGPAGGTIVTTPVSPHTTRREVRPCRSCHMDPAVLGRGGGPVELGQVEAANTADLSGFGIGYDWDKLAGADGEPLQAQTHQGARPLNNAEAARVLRFGKCIPCHVKPTDPVVRDPAKSFKRIAKGGDHYKKHKLQVEKYLK